MANIFHLVYEIKDLFRDHADSVSAVIALSAIIGASLTQVISFIARRLAYWQLRKAWRIALSLELEYLLGVIVDLMKDVKGHGYSIKRLNDDFLEDARLKGYTFDVCPTFLKRLAAAYRDVVHTNSVLDIALETYRKGLVNDAPGLESLDGVSKSIKALKKYLDRKLLRFFNPRKYRREPPEPLVTDLSSRITTAIPIPRSDGVE